METETNTYNQVDEAVNRLCAAARLIENAFAKGSAADERFGGKVEKITAAVEDASSEASAREQELERRLATAEERIGRLLASAKGDTPEQAIAQKARKTLPAETVQLLAKQGVDHLGGYEVSSIDAALAGLPLEQRFAIKAQLIRVGSLSA